MNINNGWLDEAEQQPSPHFTPRCQNEAINLLVVHNISLPPGKFGGSYITDLFLGRLDKNADPFFETIYQLEVSAHCLVRRNGDVIQYVSFEDKAWHAGVSNFKGREKCNDFSIGIELEGADDIPYTQQQYQQLAQLVKVLQAYYSIADDHIVGHSDIAPGRKTDPGDAFDWSHLYRLLSVKG